MRAPEIIDLEVRIEHETEKAVLVNHDGKTKTWLPKSLIEIDHSGNMPVITLPSQVALEKGLI